MVSFGRQKARSRLEVKKIPGVFGSNQNTIRIANTIEGMSGQNPVNPRFLNSAFDSIANPDFNTLTPAQQALIDTSLNQVQGQSAVRGLNQASDVEKIRAIAPLLINLRQQEIGNKFTGAGIEGETALNNKTINLEALGRLIENALPQIVAGQKSKASGFNFAIAKQGTGAKATTPSSSPTVSNK